MLDGLLLAAQLPEQIAKVGLGLKVVRLQLDGLQAVEICLLVLIQICKQTCQVGVSVYESLV